MKKTISAAVVAAFALTGFSAPAFADSLTIKIKPGVPVVKRVVVRQPCVNKTIKTVSGNKTVIVKKRVCS